MRRSWSLPGSLEGSIEKIFRSNTPPPPVTQPVGDSLNISAGRRQGETEADYQARIRMAELIHRNFNGPPVARPGEDETAYRTRLQAWQEKQGPVEFGVKRRRGESEASYQARVRAARRAADAKAKSRTHEPNDSEDPIDD